MSSIAIITARAGSKRIPRKNIKDFCGEPIISYGIRAALDSGVFDEVMVSTDSDEIKKIAVRYGATVPFFRSSETSNDYATTADVLQEVFTEYAKIGKVFNHYACIYPTAPFVTAHQLREAMALLRDNNADAVISVVKYSFPPQRAFLIREGKLVYQYPQYERSRSQDLEPIYHDCGQFYFGKTDVLLKEHTLVPTNTMGYLLLEEESQDIDTMSDWIVAEAKYKARERREGQQYV